MKAAQAQPLVSIIVPVYNVSPFLKKCIESITHQSYTKLEIILVDDGSTDNSGEICDIYKKKDKRIRVIHQKNGGLSSARNTGIQKATGELLSFVDSDDWLDHATIETLIKDLETTSSDISAVGRYLEYENKSTKSADNNLYELTSEKCLYKILYSKGIDNSACGKLYKIGIFKDITFPEGKEFEDTTTICHAIMSADKITFRASSMYHYRKNNLNSITHTPFSDKKLDLINLSTIITDEISSAYPKLKKACNRFLIHSYLSILARAIDTNNPDKATIRRLYNYIKAHRVTVLKDPEASKTDKAALASTFLGYRCYYMLWKYFYTLKERSK